MLTKTYKQFTKLPATKIERKLKRRNNESLRRRMKHKEKVDQEITEQELERILTKTSKEKAEGDDDIPYEFLQNLGPKAR